MHKKNTIHYLIVVAILFIGCGKSGINGELVGVDAKHLGNTETPYGMVYIPAGSLVMGQTEQDNILAQSAQSREVSVSGFYMDETEVTNSEYRQFVNWVRDSIAITDYLQDDKYYIKSKNADANQAGRKLIDWKKLGPGSSAIWGRGKGKNPNAEKLKYMFYQGDDVIFNKVEMDGRKWRYHFAMFDTRASIEGSKDRTKSRSDFMFRDTVFVYPDTNVWVNDFAYAQNEPMVLEYFSHKAYNNYPVVGVNWRQARAFSVWRSRYNDSYRDGKKIPRRKPYQLPSEAEFEYAARGGRNNTLYPWGGPSARNAKGCLMANFKSGAGNYTADGAPFTVGVKSYLPNDFGLYNMAGNVAEWTSDAYDESAYKFISDINPSYQYEASATDADALKRKVVRGGSWKDIGYFLQNGTRTYAYQDEARSYIGFRCISGYSGPIKKRK